MNLLHTLGLMTRRTADRDRAAGKRGKGNG